MESGIAEIPGRLPPEPKILRTLWRLQGPSCEIVARIERHPFGLELVIAFDGDSDDPGNVIETRLERSGAATLDARAEEVRGVLAGKGVTSPVSDP